MRHRNGAHWCAGRFRTLESACAHACVPLSAPVREGALDVCVTTSVRTCCMRTGTLRVFVHAFARVRGVWHCMVWHCRVLERTTRCSQHTFALMDAYNGLATILTMVIVDHVNMCSTAVTANAIAAIPTTAAPTTASPTAPDGTLLDRHSPPLGRAAPAATVAVVGYHCDLVRLLPRHRIPVGSILATCSRGSGGTGWR